MAVRKSTPSKAKSTEAATSEETPLVASKKGNSKQAEEDSLEDEALAIPASLDNNAEDDEDEADLEDDDWEKKEDDDEEWDPDFDEFDLPKSTAKSGSKDPDEDEDVKFDDGMEEFDDLFGDGGSNDFDDDDDY